MLNSLDKRNKVRVFTLNLVPAVYEETLSQRIRIKRRSYVIVISLIAILMIVFLLTHNKSLFSEAPKSVHNLMQANIRAEAKHQMLEDNIEQHFSDNISSDKLNAETALLASIARIRMHNAMRFTAADSRFLPDSKKLEYQQPIENPHASNDKPASDISDKIASWEASFLTQKALN